MDSKNVIAAIALSSAVIVLYSLFFIPEQPKPSQNLDEKKIEQNTDTPSIEQKETLVQISREDSLKESKRVKFENESIIGSISLKGASIDDLTFKNYNTKLESNINPPQLIAIPKLASRRGSNLSDNRPAKGEKIAMVNGWHIIIKPADVADIPFKYCKYKLTCTTLANVAV